MGLSDLANLLSFLTHILNYYSECSTHLTVHMHIFSQEQFHLSHTQCY